MSRLEDERTRVSPNAKGVIQNGHAPANQPTQRTAPREALDDCIDTFREWLHMPDPAALYLVLATIAANRTEGDPVWLLLVAPPGSGKTEVISPLKTLPDVYEAATMTEASLLSGTANKERARTAKGGLLKQIGDFGIITMKDFTSILNMNKDGRASTLAALREVHDGHWTRHVGTDGGKTLEWHGKIGIIGGVTPTIDSHHSVMGSMGERFVLYRLPEIDGESQTTVRLSHGGQEKAMRDELGRAVLKVIENLDPDQVSARPDKPTIERLYKLANITVKCRSSVERDAYTREITLIPGAEAPARIAVTLLALLNSLRAIGVHELKAWELVTKVALDSMPRVRHDTMTFLMADPTTAKNLTIIAEHLGYPPTTTRRALEDLKAHGVLKRFNGIGNAGDEWAVEEWARDHWPQPPNGEDLFTNLQVTDENKN